MNENEETGDPNKPEKAVQEDPVFYYSREHRLNRASTSVQAMNNGKPSRPGFLTSLFGSKGNMFLFISILLICFMLGLNSFFFTREKGIKLGGNTIALAAFYEGELLTLEIKKTAPDSGEAYIGPVDVRIYPALAQSKEEERKEPEHQEPEFFSHHIYFNPRSSETYRIFLPNEGHDFFVLLEIDNEQKSVRVKTRELKQGSK